MLLKSTEILTGRVVNAVPKREISNLWKCNDPPADLYWKGKMKKGAAALYKNYGFEEPQWRGMIICLYSCLVNQSSILEGFSKVLQNSHFRNGGIK